MEDVKLSRSVRVADYLDFEEAEKKERIADFILERFRERYFRPLCDDPDRKHGFCTMAICCLMIEALESFWQGWPDTNGKSRCAFESFLKRSAEKIFELGVFADHARDFYYGVRCGILHQAETTRGWRIHRTGPLFDPSTKIINATRFRDELEKVLMSYCDTLKQRDWDCAIWRNLRKKMEAVIKNCEPS